VAKRSEDKEDLGEEERSGEKRRKEVWREGGRRQDAKKA
jgi:hypothetical protein